MAMRHAEPRGGEKKGRGGGKQERGKFCYARVASRIRSQVNRVMSLSAPARFLFLVISSEEEIYIAERERERERQR